MALRRADAGVRGDRIDRHTVDVREVFLDLFDRVVRRERLDHERVRLDPDAWQIALASYGDGRGERLLGWAESRAHAFAVPARVDPVPAVPLEADRVQSMKAKGRAPAPTASLW